MSLKQTLEMMDLLDSPQARGSLVADFLETRGLRDIHIETVREPGGQTDFISIVIPGAGGRRNGGAAPTLGIIGQLGGMGARPAQMGLVSDADGGIAALAAALALGDAAGRGDKLAGDVLIRTHICPNAPTQVRRPVPMMKSPVAMRTIADRTIDPAMEAVLSVDTSRGNRVLNHRGIAITPTVKSGYILKVSDDLLDILQNATGEAPFVLPITTQDITPYDNQIHHVNSIMQPSVATDAPVVGVALTAAVAVPGSATGASQPADIEQAVRFCIEVAKAYGAGACRFYDSAEFARLVELYGPLDRLQGASR